MIFGSLLFNHALDLNYQFSSKNTISKTRPNIITIIEYLVSCWFGIFFFGLSIFYFYFKYANAQLDYVDAGVLMFCLLLMPMFEVLGVLPLYWLIMVFCPCFLFVILRKSFVVLRKRLKDVR